MNSGYIDTHAHLNIKRLNKDAANHISQAQQNNVNKIIVPGIDIKSSQLGLELAAQYPDYISPAVGIHPETVIQDNFNLPESLAQLEQLLQSSQVVAVGETGLDFHYAHTQEQQAIQKELFLAQLKLALQYNKPLIIHSREAVDDTLSILSSNWSPQLSNRMVFHCCEPEPKLLEFALENKIFIGVDGDVTYDLAKSQFIAQVPLERLVLETDAPFLLPEPLRSAKAYPNVPANLPVTAEFTANLKQVSISDLAQQTTLNALTLFGLH